MTPPPTGVVRAALRIAAIELAGQSMGRAARRLLDGGSEAEIVVVLTNALREAQSDEAVGRLLLSADDMRVLILGVIVVTREVRSEISLNVLRDAQDAGLSLRDIGEAAGVSHTAIRKRLG